jgi:predicted HTH domain antitoxin
MSITLEIPEDFAQRIGSRRADAEAQLHLELGIALYQAGRMPLGLAAEFAGLSGPEFQEVLRQRQIPMPYSLDDLNHDSAYASRGC